MSPQLELNLQKQTGAFLSYERFRERWLGRLYDRNYLNVYAWNSLWQKLEFTVGYETGDGIYYAESDSASFLGWVDYFSLEATVRPSPRLTSAVVVHRSRFSRHHGRGEVFDAWTLGAKTTWQFTRRLYARLYPQVDTDARHLDADGLVGYVVHPGTVFYAGMNNGIDRVAGHSRAVSRTVFFKVSYRLQR